MSSVTSSAKQYTTFRSVSDIVDRKKIEKSDGVPKGLIKIGSLKTQESNSFARIGVPQEEVTREKNSTFFNEKADAPVIEKGKLIMAGDRHQVLRNYFKRAVAAADTASVGVAISKPEGEEGKKITLTGYGKEVSLGFKSPKINKWKAFFSWFHPGKGWSTDSQLEKGYKKIASELGSSFKQSVKDSVEQLGKGKETELQGFLKLLSTETPEKLQKDITDQVKAQLLSDNPKLSQKTETLDTIANEIGSKIYEGMVDGAVEGCTGNIRIELEKLLTAPADAQYKDLVSKIQESYDLALNDTADVLNADRIKTRIETNLASIKQIKADLNKEVQDEKTGHKVKVHGKTLGEERFNALNDLLGEAIENIEKLKESNETILGIMGSPGEAALLEKTFHGINAAVESEMGKVHGNTAQITRFFNEKQSDVETMKVKLVNALKSGKLTEEQFAAAGKVLDGASETLVSCADFLTAELKLRESLVKADSLEGIDKLRSEISAANERFFNTKSQSKKSYSMVEQSDSRIRTNAQTRLQKINSAGDSVKEIIGIEKAFQENFNSHLVEVGSDPSKLDQKLEHVGKMEKSIQLNAGRREQLHNDFNIPKKMLGSSKEELERHRLALTRSALGMKASDTPPTATQSKANQVIDRLLTGGMGDVIQPLRTYLDGLNPSGKEEFLAKLEDARSMGGTKAIEELDRLTDPAFPTSTEIHLAIKLRILPEDLHDSAKQQHYLRKAGVYLNRAYLNTAVRDGLKYGTGQDYKTAGEFLEKVVNFVSVKGIGREVLTPLLQKYLRHLEGEKVEINPNEALQIEQILQSIAEGKLDFKSVEKARAQRIFQNFMRSIAPSYKGGLDEGLLPYLQRGKNVATTWGPVRVTNSDLSPEQKQELQPIDMMIGEMTELIAFTRADIGAKEILIDNYARAIALKTDQEPDEIIKLLNNDPIYVEVLENLIQYNLQADKQEDDTMSRAPEERAAIMQDSAAALMNSQFQLRGTREIDTGSRGKILGRLKNIGSKIGSLIKKRSVLPKDVQAVMGNKIRNKEMADLYNPMINERATIEAQRRVLPEYEDAMRILELQRNDIVGKEDSLNCERTLVAAVVESWANSGEVEKSFRMTPEKHKAIIEKLDRLGVNSQRYPFINNILDEIEHSAGKGEFEVWMGKQRHLINEKATNLRNDWAGLLEDIRTFHQVLQTNTRFFADKAGLPEDREEGGMTVWSPIWCDSLTNLFPPEKNAHWITNISKNENAGDWSYTKYIRTSSSSDFTDLKFQDGMQMTCEALDLSKNEQAQELKVVIMAISEIDNIIEEQNALIEKRQPPTYNAKQLKDYLNLHLEKVENFKSSHSSSATFDSVLDRLRKDKPGIKRELERRIDIILHPKRLELLNSGLGSMTTSQRIPAPGQPSASGSAIDPSKKKLAEQPASARGTGSVPSNTPLNTPKKAEVPFKEPSGTSTAQQSPATLQKKAEPQKVQQTPSSVAKPVASQGPEDINLAPLNSKAPAQASGTGVKQQSNPQPTQPATPSPKSATVQSQANPRQVQQAAASVQNVAGKGVTAAELQNKYGLDNPKSTDCFHNSAVQLIRGMDSYFLSALNNSVVSQQKEVQRLEQELKGLIMLADKAENKEYFSEDISSYKKALEVSKEELKKRITFSSSAKDSITNFMNGSRPNPQELRKNILNGIGAVNDSKSGVEFAHDNGKSNKQNDAAELILKLLKLSGAEGPEVESILTTKLKGNSNTSTLSKEKEAMLNLEIRANGTNNTTLQECIEDFLSEEVMVQSELPYVQGTSNKAESAIKQLKVVSTPEHLVFSLKRFKGNGTKIDAGVDVMNNIKLNNRDYQPVSIVCHIGKNRDSGHYVTYQNVEGKWFLLNDVTVTEVTNMDSISDFGDSHRNIINKNAYVIDLKKN